MQSVKEKQVSARLVPADFAKLESAARRRFSKPGTLAAAILSQQLRRLTHPAIDFQELPEGGAVARIAGRRLSVWLVVEEARRAGKKKAAELLALPPALLVAALNYAAEYPEEIAEDARRGRQSLKQSGLEVPA